MKREKLATLLVLLVLSVSAVGQATSYCSSHPEKLACVLSNLTLNANSPSGTVVGGINAALGTQLGLVPLASPASGIIYSTDPSLQITVPVGNETFGPVLTERGETIGRHKLFIAFTYQHFKFNSIDNVSLKDIPIIFQQGNVLLDTSTATDITLNQYTVFATYGITDRIDTSVAVPFVNTSVSGTTTCRKATDTNGVFLGSCSFAVNGSPQLAQSGDATGISDIVLRLKANLIKGERFRVAAGVDVRIPTGDEFNFLGTGATGVKPFVAASLRGRFSPHLNLGFQWNGDSDIGSVKGPGIQGKLPNNFFYNLGADIRIVKRLTFAADFLGEYVSDAIRVVKAHPIPGDLNDFSVITPSGSFNTARAAAGIKVNPFGNLLVTANVLFKLEHNGLSHRTAPLVGASYTF